MAMSHFYCLSLLILFVVAVEGAERSKSRLYSDIIHREVGIFRYQLFGMCDPLSVDELIESDTHLLVDSLIDIGTVSAHHPCEVFQFQIRLQEYLVLLNEFHDTLRQCSVKGGLLILLLADDGFVTIHVDDGELPMYTR